MQPTALYQLSWGLVFEVISNSWRDGFLKSFSRMVIFLILAHYRVASDCIVKETLVREPASSQSCLKTTRPNALSFRPHHKSPLFASPVSGTHPTCLENSGNIQNTQPAPLLK